MPRSTATAEACVFCRIVAGEVAAAVVHDGPDGVAFLDHRPLFPGHVLIVPRPHVATLPELPERQVAPLFLLLRRMTVAVEAALDAPGTFVAMNQRVSQSVPHLHVHVVPRRPRDGLKGFFWPRRPYDGPAHVARVADAIRHALAAAGADP